MPRIVFLVQGSTPEPYQVSFQLENQRFVAACSCPAGIMHQICKHRLAILAGDASNIVSPNTNEVSTVVSWLPGTPIERALAELHEAEKQVELTKKLVIKAKKTLVNAMMPGPP